MTTQLWDQLHQQEKHQLRYPSEHVVRWLSSLGKANGREAIDIGCGFGRHMELMTEYGFVATGVDLPGDMRDLPFDDETFDVALAYGVFYYGTRKDHLNAISELYRVLKPGGHALIVTRTLADSRSHGEFERVVTEGDEAGMTMNFTAQEDIRRDYGLFSQVSYERSETTRDSRKWKDSDWLISVTK